MDALSIIDELVNLLSEIETHRIIELEHENKPLENDIILKYCNERHKLENNNV